MGKIWVDIVPGVSPDGSDAKKALTKSVKTDIEEAMTKAIVDGLPSNFSEKDSDKPKGTRDDYAARAVRLVPEIKMSLETKGAKVETGGKVSVKLEMLKLKSANESGEYVAQVSTKISGVEKRGAIDDVVVDLAKLLIKEAGMSDMAKKLLSGSEFKKLAEQRNLPLD